MPTTLWQTRTMFVSSTFADMHAERDYLYHFVFPELAERLQERQHHLEAIDLRGAAEKPAPEEEQAKESLVLKMCLSEIARSRPFFIGLIGDCYGWTPASERLQAAVQEQGFVTDVRGKSVTALEIEFGALEGHDVPRRCHIYLRSPLPYDQMPREVARRYSDAYSAAPDASQVVSRLTDLKRRIIDHPALAGRVHAYRAEWDPVSRSVTGLDDWGQQVLEDLWTDLDAVTSGSIATAFTSSRDEDRWLLEKFVERHARGFVGRSDLTAELLRHVRSASWETLRWGVCVTGESGSGKSALFAHLHRELAESDNVLLLSHAAGIGSRSSRVDVMLEGWVRTLSEVLGEHSTLPENAPPERIEQLFRRYLSRAAESRRVVILIDALNQFEQTPRAQHVTWLPKALPTNVRLIATAVPGLESRSLVSRAGARDVPLPALTAEEARQIAQGVCRRYHRVLDTSTLAELLEKKAHGTNASSSPLWLEIALEELNLLDADDYSRANTTYTGSFDERLRQMLHDAARALPSDIDGIYAYLLDRIERLFGVFWARAFVNLLGVSHNGWRESDLRALLPRAATVLRAQPSTKADVIGEWNALQFARVRRSLRGHLLERGAHGQWDFSHEHARTAIQRRNLQTLSLEQEFHSLIARHLFSLPPSDPVRSAELMAHLLGSRDRQSTVRYYAGPLETAELYDATRALASYIASGTDEKPNPHLRWTISLLQEPVDDAARIALCRRYVSPLVDLVGQTADISTCGYILESVVQVATEIAERCPDSPDYHETVMEAQAQLGQIQREEGKASEALSSYRAAVETAQRGARKWPEKDAWLRVQSYACGGIGDILSAQGDLSGALAAFWDGLTLCASWVALLPRDISAHLRVARLGNRICHVLIEQNELAQAEEIRRKVFDWSQHIARAVPNSPEVRLCLSVGYVTAGDLYSAKGDRVQALEQFREAARIRQELMDQDPSDTHIQRELASSLNRVGVTLMAQGNLREALTPLEQTAEISQRLANTDATDAGYARDLAVAYFQLSRIHHELGDRDTSEGYFSDCYQVLVSMRQVGMVLDERMRRIAEAADTLYAGGD